MKKLMKWVLSVVCILAGTILYGQALKVKNTFGNNGFIRKNIGTDGTNYIYTTVVQSDGKIIVGGDLIYRVNDQAEIDPTFGTNGFVDHTTAGGTSHMAVQTDNKILYTLSNHEDSIAIRRLTSNGMPDSTFNSTSEIVIGEENCRLFSTSIQMQADGKILVAAQAQQYEPFYKNKIFVARFLANGQPDNSFDSDGKILIELSGYDDVYDIGVQSDGKIIITGALYPTPQDSRNLYVIRLFSNGTRDLTFNGTGIVQFGLPNSSGEYGYLIHVYNNNKILVAGGSSGNLLLLRLNANGSYDNTFSGDGLLSVSYGLFNNVSKIHLLAGNKILITGTTDFYPSGNHGDFAAFKFDDAGNLDASFNGTGKTFLPGDQNDHVAGSTVLSDGKIMLLGFRDSIPVLTSAKISSGGIFDLSYGSNGFKYNIFRPTDESITKLMTQSDGKVVALVSKNPGVLNPSIAVLVRYNVDGILDNSFGTGGIKYIDSADTQSWYMSAAMQSDDKILVACLKEEPASGNQSRVILTRYNANGSVDNTFNAAAFSLLSFGYNTGLDITLDATGNIFVAFSLYDYYNDHYIYKLNTTGQIDLSYGNMGKVILSEPDYPGLRARLTIQQDGKLLIPGVASNIEKFNYYFLRLNNDGMVDLNFADNGIYKNPENEANVISMLELQVTPDQKIVVAGYLHNYDDNSHIIKIEKLLSNGNADSSFNGNGAQAITYSMSGNTDDIYAIPLALAIHPDSSIYLNGQYGAEEGSNFYNFIIRIKKNGTLDSALSVDGTGWYTVTSTGPYDYISGIHFAADSTLYIGGEKWGSLSDYDFTLRAFKRLPSYQGRVYTFTGSGNWNNTSNWHNNAIPPSPLPDGSIIVVDPIPGSTSILNVPQSINPGGSINVKSGSKLVIQGNLNIAN